MRRHAGLAALATAALTLAGVQSGWAQSGFGLRSAPQGASGPGTIAAARTIAAQGGSLSGTVHGTRVRTVAPRRAFRRRVQVRITKPRLKSIQRRLRAQRAAFRVVGVVGLEIRSGASQHVTPRRALRLTLKGKAVRSRRVVLAIVTKDRIERVPYTRVGNTLRFRLEREADVSILIPR